MRLLRLFRGSLFSAGIAAAFSGCYSNSAINWSLTTDILPAIVPGQENGLGWAEGSLSAVPGVTAIWTPSISSLLAVQRIQFHTGVGCGSPLGAAINLGPGVSSQTLIGTDGQTYSFGIYSLDIHGGIITASCSSTITVDTSPPVLDRATVTLSSPTNSMTYPLDFGAITGTYSSYCIRENSTSVGGCSWVNGSLPASFTVSVIEEEKILSIWLRDAAGNISARVDTNPVTLLTTPPSLASATITNPTPTNSTTYNLIYGSITGAPSEYCILENFTTIGGCLWTPVPLPSEFTVSSVQNSKILYIWLKDAAGNVSARVNTNAVTLLIAAPVLAWSPLTYSFGSITVGTNSHTLTLTLSNTGGATSGCSAPVLTNTTDFTLVTDQCGSMNLSTSEQCHVILRANPATTGAKSTTLSRSCSIGGTPSTTANGITVSGINPAPLVAWVATSAAFGVVRTSSTSFIREMILRNTGSASATGCSAPALSGTNPSDFEITGDTCGSANLVPGGQCSVFVRGRPSVAGARTASLARSCTIGGSASLTLTTTGATGGAIVVAGGGAHSCAVLSDGVLQCWGSNSSGQLGGGALYVDVHVPTNISGISNAVAVTAGWLHTCAVLSTGVVKCWGSNSYGQLGDGTKTQRQTPTSVLGVSNAIGVATSREGMHTCAVLSNGEVKCWGQNGIGQLGDETNTESLTPVQVARISGAEEVTTGRAHTCARLSDGTVWCWGGNNNGQLGIGSTASSFIPVQVPGINDAVEITSQAAHTCARLSDLTIRCWGSNSSGQIGDGTTMQRNTPIDPGLTGVISLRAGESHTCAAFQSGAVRCWGSNGYGKLGDLTTTTRHTPVLVDTLTSGVLVGVGFSHSCAVISGGGIRCWGLNASGQLGDGSAMARFVPVAATGLTTSQQVATGDRHTCVVQTNGSVQCWGYNGFGALGNGTTTHSYVPVNVPLATTASAVAAGYNHSCALLTDGRVQCWGAGGHGQNGDIAMSFCRLSPITVSGISTATTITAGDYHSCARLADETIRCWGLNVDGQLGNGTYTRSATPVSVSGITTASSVAAGSRHTCSRLTDGTVSCWGYNLSGQLGNGSNVTSPVPVKVSSIITAASVATGASHTCALLTGGSVRCWGSNSTYQLGDGGTASKTAPVSVTGIASAGSVVAGVKHTCALLLSGEVRCWGSNVLGTLGIGYGISSSTATPITSIGSIVSLFSGSSAQHSCAIRNTGDLFCWGDNEFNQTGYNETQIRAVSGL